MTSKRGATSYNNGRINTMYAANPHQINQFIYRLNGACSRLSANSALQTWALLTDRAKRHYARRALALCMAHEKKTQNANISLGYIGSWELLHQLMLVGLVEV